MRLFPCGGSCPAAALSQGRTRGGGQALGRRHLPEPELGERRHPLRFEKETPGSLEVRPAGGCSAGGKCSTRRFFFKTPFRPPGWRGALKYPSASAMPPSTEALYLRLRCPSLPRPSLGIRLTTTCTCCGRWESSREPRVTGAASRSSGKDPYACPASASATRSGRLKADSGRPSRSLLRAGQAVVAGTLCGTGRPFNGRIKRPDPAFRLSQRGASGRGDLSSHAPKGGEPRGSDDANSNSWRSPKAATLLFRTTPGPCTWPRHSAYRWWRFSGQPTRGRPGRWGSGLPS